MYFDIHLLVLVMVFVYSDAGGHEDNHHDHVKLHVPEFIHHNHHTKVITIHHHHHKPKNEHHHHHHHHHHKPVIPHGPQPYHHTKHHLKSSTRTVSKGHTSLGQKSSGHLGHRVVNGNRGHRGHVEKYHKIPANHEPPKINYEPPTLNYQPPEVNYQPPAVNYQPPAVNHVSPTANYGGSAVVGSDYGSFLPSVQGLATPPHLHGVVHTIKQVKVFDSLPGALQGNIGNTGAKDSKGYEVTEHGDEGEDDIFTSVNSLSQAYPATYDFVRNAASEQDSDSFSDISQSNSVQSYNGDPFAGAQPLPTYSNNEDYIIHNYSPSAPAVPNVGPSAVSEPNVFNVPANAAFGGDVNGNSLLTFPEDVNEDTPVIFTREAGLQHAVNTGGVETIAY